MGIWQGAGRALGLESELRFKSQLCHFLAMLPWVSHSGHLATFVTAS